MVSSIQFQSKKKTKTNLISIAAPSKDSGAITVICGKNHSGKSYMLRRIQRNVVSRNQLIKKGLVVEAEVVSTDDIGCYFIGSEGPLSSVYVSNILNIAKLARGTSTTQESNHKNRRHFSGRAENYDQIQIKECLEILVADVLQSYHFKQGLGFDINNWRDPKQTEYRINLLNTLLEKYIYRVTADLEIISLFERLTEGKLFFGVVTPKNNLPIFELFLVFDEDIIIPLSNWSEGQQVLFTLLILLYYKKPDILLFDEIENHLHPEFISVILGYVKKNVPQTIISTHHPHIIFSRYVDVVHFLELEKPLVELPDVIEYDRQRSKSPVRNVYALEKTYSKLISTYKLFDSYDNLLLRISSSNIENLNELLVNTFTNLFFYDVVPPDPTKNPDLQSQKLYELFTAKMGRKKIKVLEIGAGDGRILVDVNKMLRVNEKENIHWTLFEPNQIHRQKIEENISKSHYKHLISVTGTLQDEEYDFILIANVLHELVPSEIAKILTYCQRNLVEQGKALVVELYPLLNPEKYAVPLTGAEWVSLARKLGFNAIEESINFRNASVEAYFIELSSLKSETKSADEMERIVTDFWETTVIENRTGDYAGHIQLDKSEQIPRIIGNLTSLASIQAHRKGFWR